MSFIKGITKSNANRDQSQLQTSTNVATVRSHIHQDLHPAWPKIDLQQVWEGWTLKAKMPWRFAKEITEETTKERDRQRTKDR